MSADVTVPANITLLPPVEPFHRSDMASCPSAHEKGHMRSDQRELILYDPAVIGDAGPLWVNIEH